MASQSDPFATIESAHEFVRLLREAATEAICDIADETADAAAQHAARRIEALRLVEYKLEQLCAHLDSSRRLLNDLRMLQRLLLREGPGENRT